MTCDYFSFFFQINWYDHHGNLVNDATYKSFRMRDSKTFEARSSIRFTPRKEHHNQTYRCEAWNEAGDNLRPALARLFVEYAPSVTVTPVRPGMIQEGDKVLILRLTYIILAKGFYLVAHGLCTRSPSIMAFFVQYAPSVTSVVVRPFSSLCLG